MPFRQTENHAKMPHRNLLTVNPIMRFITAAVPTQVGHNLVAEEVKIDPFGRGTTLRTAQQGSVERAGLGKVAHRKCQVEPGWGGHVLAFVAGLFEREASPAGKGKSMRKKAPHLSRGDQRRVLLKIDGQAVPVTVKINPRARRLIVKVHPSTGEVSVVASSRRALEHALDFARTEKEWIAGRLADVPPPVMLGLGARIPFRGEEHVIRQGGSMGKPVWIERDEDSLIIRVSGRSEHAGRRVLDFLKREARRRLESRVMEYARILGVSPRRITVRDTASRWGSCSSSRSLSFSWRLILAPPFVLDYVVAHEVAHLRELNHSPRFWALVERLVPDLRRAQDWLAGKGTELYRYAPRIERN